MSTQYICKTAARRDAVRTTRGADGRPVLNGIDYLEVEPGTQQRLRVHFIHPLAGEPDAVPPAPALPLTADNVIIEGGVRIKNIVVRSVSANADVLSVEVVAPGDFSTYTLRLAQSAIDRHTPAGFDPRLSAVDFSFKVECPSDFDCKIDVSSASPAAAEPEISYLAKDYASFRQLMLDRLSDVLPGWRDRNAADLQMVLVEMLAHVGDSLSYYQDAVATEAYLGTARKRTSVRRHARLLDYFMHEGSNARAWICLEVEEGGSADGASLPSGTPLLTRGRDSAVVVKPAEVQKLLQQESPEVFETLHAAALRASHNRISFYTWSDQECCLPKGATRATLLDRFDASMQRMLAVKPGDVLIFEELLSPITGLAGDADPTRRYAVRLIDRTLDVDPLTGTPVVEIEWGDEDALPAAMWLTARVTDLDGQPAIVETTAVRGNVALADHGITVEETLPPVAANVCYRPALQSAPLTFGAPIDLRASAAAVMKYEARGSSPTISLRGEDGVWTARYDLLVSDPFGQEFVVEMRSDGVAELRFGDGISGKLPPAGATFTATYRQGNGARGNVGAESIARVVWSGDGIRSVRNPIAAAGGIEPETLEQVRQFAPQAFRRQERAVTEADYAEIAERNADVQQAAGVLRWTGSWYTAFVTVDRTGGRIADPPFRQKIQQYLERYRMAGCDLEVDAPTFVPLLLTLDVCVAPGYFQSDVQQAVLQAFSSQDLQNGQRGFFHPDNFTFGQPVYLSQIYRTAMQVAGVNSVDVTKLQRWGAPPAGEIENGALTPASLEIVQLDNDPNFPENGKIEILMRGGL
ncbi:MAG TPA: putative baseplate assembly protein [Steroidobacter sp.]